MPTRYVRGSTTSLNGCKIEIDGYLVYTIIPPRITGFRGSVHITGKPGCPNGDLFFGPKSESNTVLSRTANKGKY
jgi:hypothetical protein